MRHQDFNIIFQPPKDATPGFVIIKKCCFKSRSYGSVKVKVESSGQGSSIEAKLDRQTDWK